MKKTLLSLVAAAALCVPLTACGSGSEGGSQPDPVPAAEQAQETSEDELSPDYYYLTAVRMVQPSLEVVPDDDLISLGHSVCDTLEVGANLAEVAVAMTGPDGLDGGQAGAVSGGAIHAYCPEFTYLIPTE